MPTKFRQLTLAGSPPALTATIVGVGIGAGDDLQYTLQQIATTVGVAVANKKYVEVAASQTSFLLGATGAIGDYLASLLVVPATTSPGAITISDSITGPAIPIFAGGTGSINDLTPFTINIGLPSAAGGWYVTTGVNVSVLAAGNFT